MSLPTEIADGPNGPEPIISISKRTAFAIMLGAVMLVFSLLTVIWVLYSVYSDARDDLALIRTQNECSRQLNADVVVAQGEYLQQLGTLNEQIAKVFAALPTPEQDSSGFFTEIGKFDAIAVELHRLLGLYDQALTAYSQVNALCKDGTPSTTEVNSG